MTAPHLAPGHSIAGKYRIVALLGFTGEVATYRVAGPQAEDLVVKLYDSAIGQRADVMSRLEHVHATLASLPPGAVRVIDSGYDLGTGAPFAATEYLNLPSLAQICARQPMALEAVTGLLAGIAQVMDAAHERQLHHLALKPTNLFLGQDGIRITDFDAAVVRNTSPTHEAYTRSAPWWAPEQLNPSAVVGPATDVFAVGLLLFFALTGRSYWLSCQSSQPDLQRWQAEVMAPRMLASQRARELSVSINPALDVVFERALAVSQSERPRSIGELANAFSSLAGYRTDAGVKTMAFPETVSPLDVSGYPEAFGRVGASGPVTSGAAPNPVSDGSGGPFATALSANAQTPGLPPIPLQPQRQKSPIIPIILGVGVALLIGAVGVTLLFTRAHDDTVAQEAAAGSEATPAATADDEPRTGGADEPREEATATQGEGGAPPEEPARVKVTVRCEPACDEVWVDGKKVDEPGKDLELDPGRHELKMVAKGYFPRTAVIEVEPDEPLVNDYRLVPIGSAPRPKPKPCGQFLKPCP